VTAATAKTTTADTVDESARRAVADAMHDAATTASEHAAQPARNAEWGTEFYYNYTIFKGLWITPDVQLYFDPALKPGAGPAAVFTIRTTAFF
jgi:carbohydrate-selective porin OprB